MAGSVEIRALEDGLFILDKVAQIGQMTSAMLAAAPGWNRTTAWRYLEVLTRTGYLAKVKNGGKTLYFLGPKFLERGVLTLG